MIWFIHLVWVLKRSLAAHSSSRKTVIASTGNSNEYRSCRNGRLCVMRAEGPMGTCDNRRRSKLDLKSHGVAGARDRCWMYRCGVASAQRVSVLLSVFDCLFATNEQKREQERGLHWSMGFGVMSGIEVGTRKILGYRSVSSHGVLICRRPLFGVSYLFCQQVHLGSRHGCGGL